MQNTCTLLELLFNGHEPAEIATKIEKGEALIRDRYGRLGVAEGSDRQKLLDQVAYHSAMQGECNKPWKYWSEDARDYWAHGKTRPNQDYGGDQPPEIDRAWFTSSLKESPQKTPSSDNQLSGQQLANKRWAEYNNQKTKAIEHAKAIIARSNLLHNEVADELSQSGYYPKLKRAALVSIAAKACDALGVGNNRVKGRRTRA